MVTVSCSFLIQNVFTFHRDLVLSGVGMSENLHMDGHLSHSVVHPGAWWDRGHRAGGETGL